MTGSGGYKSGRDVFEAKAKDLGAVAFFIKSNVSMEQVVKIVKYCLKIKE